MSFFPQGSFYGIGLMGKSLSTFQYAENITSDNIANVNTPGASQQDVELTEAPPIVGTPGYPNAIGGTSGDGVTVSTVQRIQSTSYDELFRGASASQNYFQTEQQSLQAIQSSFGDPSAGVNAAYTAFQAAVNQLVAQPSTGSTTSLGENVLSTAQTLTSALNSDATVVSQQKASVMTQAGTMVQSINALLDQIASLNGQIRASTAAGDSPNTYEDQRDYAIDQLSQYVPTQTAIQADGSVLVTVSGQALVNDTTAYHLATPTIGTASNGASVFKVDFVSTPPAASSAAGIPLGSGQLGALEDLYNNKLVPYGTQLDQFTSGLANEVNRITTASYTASGDAGEPLFQPVVATLPISASNMKVGIADASQLPSVLASTISGSLVTPLVNPANSSNNAVDPAQAIDGYTALANFPPADVPGPGGTAGSLTVTVDGVAQTFKYETDAGNPGANATSINQFVSSFNTAHMGVTASYDSSAQKIVFTRDPSNEDAYLRAEQATNPESPDFTIQDTPSRSIGILQTLGASGINGVPQNASNALGAGDNGTANALVSLFGNDVGIPALQITSGAGVTATAGTAVTVAIPLGSVYTSPITVGQVLTIDAQPGGASPQENVTVTAVSYDTNTGQESVTFTPAQNHAANFSIASAPTQTLGQFYGAFITQVGLDAQTANTGTTTQTALTSNIDQVRQGIQGINLDEETQNLIKYQSAYSAAAQTINVLNQILNTTITSLGVGG